MNQDILMDYTVHTPKLNLYQVAYVQQFVGVNKEEAAFKCSQALAPVLKGHVEFEIQEVNIEDDSISDVTDYVLVNPAPLTLLQRIGIFIYNLG